MTDSDLEALARIADGRTAAHPEAIEAAARFVARARETQIERIVCSNPACGAEQADVPYQKCSRYPKVPYC